MILTEDIDTGSHSRAKTQYSILIAVIVVTHLAHSAVPASLHVVLALVASVDKAVLSLVVQLNQHAHGAPLAPPEGAELPVFVPGQGQEGIAAIHQVTREHGVRVNDGRQGVGHGTGVEVDHKEHLQQTEKNTETRVREAQAKLKTGIKTLKDLHPKSLHITALHIKLSESNRKEANLVFDKLLTCVHHL